MAGTDRDQTWLKWLYALTVAAVVIAAALRFGRAPGARRYGIGIALAGGALLAVLGLARAVFEVRKENHRVVAFHERCGARHTRA